MLLGSCRLPFPLFFTVQVGPIDLSFQPSSWLLFPALLIQLILSITSGTGTTIWHLVFTAPHSQLPYSKC